MADPSSVVTFVGFITQYGQVGVFGVLFCVLFWNTQKDGKEREAKLIAEIQNSHELLKEFATRYDIVVKKIDDLQESFSKSVNSSVLSEKKGV